MARVACLWSTRSRTWPGSPRIARGLGNPFEYLLPLLDGHDCAVIEAGDDEDADIALLRRHDPEVVLVSALTAGADRAHRLIRALRGRGRTLRTIWGGWHAAAFPELLLSEGIDTVILGPGENALSGLSSFADLPFGILDVRDRPRVWSEGVKLGLGAMVSPGFREGASIATLSAIDGCPQACTFCAQRHTRYQIRPRPLVEREIDAIVRSGAAGFFLLDGNPMAHGPAFLELCSAVHAVAGERIAWRTFGDCPSIHDAAVAEFRRSGGRNIYIGVETADIETAKRWGLSRKTLSRRPAEQAAEIMRRHGVYVTASLIVGDPSREEDPDVVQALLSRIRPDFLALHQLMPIPGTPLWAELAPKMRPGLTFGDLDQFNPDGYFTYSVPPFAVMNQIARTYYGSDVYARLVEERQDQLGRTYLDEMGTVRVFARRFGVDPWARLAPRPGIDDKASTLAEEAVT